MPCVVSGTAFSMLSLRHLVEDKRAVGRPQDLADIARLQSLEKGLPVQWHFGTGLPPAERLMSPGRSGPGAHSGLFKNPRIAVFNRRQRFLGPFVDF